MDILRYRIFPNKPSGVYYFRAPNLPSMFFENAGENKVDSDGSFSKEKFRTKIGNSTTFRSDLLDHGFKPGFSHIPGLATQKFLLFLILFIRTNSCYCLSNHFHYAPKLPKSMYPHISYQLIRINVIIKCHFY